MPVGEKRSGGTTLFSRYSELLSAHWFGPILFFWGLPIFLEFVSRLRSGKFPVGVAAIGAAALAPFYLWYFYWSPHLVEHYGLRYFYVGGSLSDNLGALADASVWLKLLKTLLQNYIGWLGIPVFIAGVWWLLKNRKLRFGDPHLVLCISVPLLGVAVLLLLTGRHFIWHEYYLFALIPSIALINARGLAAIESHYPTIFRWALPLLLIGTVATHLHIYRPKSFFDEQSRLRDEVATETSQEDLFAVEDKGRYSGHLYAIRRRGWVCSGDELRDPAYVLKLKSLGLKWVLVWVDGTYHLREIDSWIKQIE